MLKVDQTEQERAEEDMMEGVGQRLEADAQAGEGPADVIAAVADGYLAFADRLANQPAGGVGGHAKTERPGAPRAVAAGRRALPQGLVGAMVVVGWDARHSSFSFAQGTSLHSSLLQTQLKEKTHQT